MGSSAGSNSPLFSHLRIGKMKGHALRFGECQAPLHDADRLGVAVDQDEVPTDLWKKVKGGVV